MEGTVIDTVKYMDGHWQLQNKSWVVKLIAYPSNLAVVRVIDNTPLFSIPWQIMDNVFDSVVSKEGLASFVSYAINQIFPVTSQFYDVIFIEFFDEEIQREQRVTFATGSSRKAENLARKIMSMRDNYFRLLKQSSGPARR